MYEGARYDMPSQEFLDVIMKKAKQKNVLLFLMR